MGSAGGGFPYLVPSLLPVTAPAAVCLTLFKPDCSSNSINTDVHMGKYMYMYMYMRVSNVLNNFLAMSCVLNTFIVINDIVDDNISLVDDVDVNKLCIVMHHRFTSI